MALHLFILQENKLEERSNFRLLCLYSNAENLVFPLNSESRIRAVDKP